MILLLVALLGLDLAQFTDRADAGWAAYTTKGGVTLERRKVPGSKFYEHRAVLDLPVDVDHAATEIWSALRGSDMENLKHRTIIKDTPDELVIYDQISTPVVSDRDYTITVRRIYDATRRRTQFRCETRNDLGPPPAPGYVRIPYLSAGWQVEPDGKGGTRLSHFAYSEPGGLIAAFVVRGPQADRSLADTIRMARRLLK
jgi:hypothetical protein